MFHAATLLCLLFGICFGGQFQVTGDMRFFDSLFSSREPELVATGFEWTEGPTWVEDYLLFSDTVKDKIYKYTPATKAVEIFLENSGGCTKPQDLSWRAEPGSNGILYDPLIPNSIFFAQHCQRRVVRLNLQTKEITVVAATFKGVRLNSPNDLTFNKDKTLIYFTDPIYGFLEKTKFSDQPYLDAKSDIGYSGVYSVPVNNGVDQVQLIHQFFRPNGIHFDEFRNKLVISECCQSDHNPQCRQGQARWYIFDVNTYGKVQQNRNSPKTVRLDLTGTGCADGFKVHLYGFIIGSCPGGLCIISMESGTLVAQVFFGGSKLSNIGFGGGYAYVTGEKALWRIPMTFEAHQKAIESFRVEL